MRPKFVIVLLLLAWLVLGGALVLKRSLEHKTAPPANSLAVTPAPSADSNALAQAPSPPEPAPVPVPVAATPAKTLTDEARQAAIDEEIDRLQTWSANDDPQSLSNILADLNNPEKDIRDAAIEAAKQFGSTNAIPALKAAADATDDPHEKVALLEAAEFLSLPSLTDLRAQAPPLTPEQLQANQQREAQIQSRRHPQRQPPGGQSAPGQGQPATPNP